MAGRKFVMKILPNLNMQLISKLPLRRRKKIILSRIYCAVSSSESGINWINQLAFGEFCLSFLAKSKTSSREKWLERLNYRICSCLRCLKCQQQIFLALPASSLFPFLQSSERRVNPRGAARGRDKQAKPFSPVFSIPPLSRIQCIW